MKPNEKLAIEEKMKVDQKEFDVLKENQMVKLLIEVEKMASSDAPRSEKGITIREKEKEVVKKPKEEEIKKSSEQDAASKKEYKINKGFILPPGVETQEQSKVSLELAKEDKDADAPKGKKKVKVKKKSKKPEKTVNE
jgi:hypothetical protein